MRLTTTPSERRSSPVIVWGGAAVALLLLLYLLFGRGGDEAPAPVAPPPAPAPTPAPVAATPSPAQAAPAASVEGLRLHGVAGAGAIIGTGDGNQRLVAIGREVRPGILLVGVGVDHALLRAGTTTYRLGFDGIAAAGAAPPASPSGTEALREETLRYRLALAPVTSNGRVTGHVVRDGAGVPALARAGIRSGDVIQRVNGAEFDAERLEELAWTLANTDRTAFDIMRDGQPIRLTLAR